ncbi:hypothetical protein BWQ96_00489 [Gracilariopsis chorda]|uniref:Uncharacterized protein n=1 Tax=Gracilariopsis chorda TaxID=448386 RepID=A0A2V3J791_9FLOR|nr:hypothetical protein BWQ96_00489 [Gracilariopsis chorda]|eukprot:PXF49837.1 hypothetical protein BWQ96_00489 [Gracilariopsis chorda]
MLIRKVSFITVCFCATVLLLCYQQFGSKSHSSRALIPERLFFITYGSKPFYNTKARLLYEVRSLNIFEEAFGYGPDDLSTAFMRKFGDVLVRKRGGGYWIWKFAIIRQTLNLLNNNDFLVYADAGCSVDREHVSHFLKSLNILRSSNHGFLAYERKEKEREWTSTALFEAFNVSNMRHITDSPQYDASVLIMRKNAHLEQCLRLAERVLEKDPFLITDEYPTNKTLHPYFKENRHDQSILSVSRKLCKAPTVRLAERKLLKTSRKRYCCPGFLNSICMQKKKNAERLWCLISDIESRYVTDYRIMCVHNGRSRGQHKLWWSRSRNYLRNLVHYLKTKPGREES